MKKCEQCGKEIPEEFVNNLCWDCYKKQDEAKGEPQNTDEAKPFDLKVVKNGLTDPDYIENEEKPDKEQWLTNIHLFERHGVMLWKPTRQMYTYLKDYCLDGITKHPQYPKFIWRPKIVDVGCGCGVGSNVLSQEADFVWGIDKNEKSIRFAKECFERVKNQIYYSSQVSFDVMDIFANDNRETLKFDIVVAIEIIEHVDDYQGFLRAIIDKFAKKMKEGLYNVLEPTEFFISTPNRNNRHLTKATPKNKFHVREWTAPEFYNILCDYFKNIEFKNAIGVDIPYSEIMETTHTPIIAHCWNPK